MPFFQSKIRQLSALILLPSPPPRTYNININNSKYILCKKKSAERDRKDHARHVTLQLCNYIYTNNYTNQQLDYELEISMRR